MLPDLFDTVHAGLSDPRVWASAWVFALVSLAAVAVMLRRNRTNTRSQTSQASDPDLTEMVLTLGVAAVASVVSVQGMWKFFGEVLGFSGLSRALLFTFIELAAVVSAWRARRSLQKRGYVGADGTAVWVFASLTAVFSAMDARGVPEILFRLAAPLVAAWLWDRGLALERDTTSSAGKRSRIHWRVTPQRVLVRLGLAEPTERNVSQVDAHRRLAKLAHVVWRTRHTRSRGLGLRHWWALRLLRRRTAKAVEHADLASDPDRQAALLAQIATLVHAENLADAAFPAPWAAVTAPWAAIAGNASQTPSGSALGIASLGVVGSASEGPGNTYSHDAEAVRVAVPGVLPEAGSPQSGISIGSASGAGSKEIGNTSRSASRTQTARATRSPAPAASGSVRPRSDEQVRELVREALAQDPELSKRALARKIGARFGRVAAAVEEIKGNGRPK